MTNRNYLVGIASVAVACVALAAFASQTIAGNKSDDIVSAPASGDGSAGVGTPDENASPMLGGTCTCTGWGDFYDDSCGAGCGYLGTRNRVRSQLQYSASGCYNSCVGFMFSNGRAGCGQFGAATAKIAGEWNYANQVGGRFNSGNYYQYACSDL